MAANIFQSGGVNNNYSNGANWSLGVAPTASDGNIATFNGTSPNCTVDVASAANAIDFTGYTNTITMTNGLTIHGNITLASGMTITGSASLTVADTATLTSNGKAWPNTLAASTSTFTITLADNWTVGAYSNGSTITINGFTLNITGNLTVSGFSLSGTTNIVMNGTGIWSGSGSLKKNITFNTAGTITVSGTVNFDTGTITYTLGTIATSGSTLNFTGSATINASAVTWNNVSATATTVLTLSANLNLSGTLSVTTPAFTLNGNTAFVGGGLTLGVSGVFLGTTAIVLNGTGIWSGGEVRNNLTINTAGTITVSGTVVYNTGTLTYTSGTVSSSGGILNISNSCTLNTSGMTWSSITCGTSSSVVVTLSSNLNVIDFSKTGITLNSFNGNTLNISGSLSVLSSGFLAGTTNIILNGTGTWSGTGTLRNSLTINTSGTITISGSVTYDTGTLTYTAGTTVVSGSTLNITLTCTLNTSGMNWNNISLFPGGSTITLTSNLNISGNFLVSQGVLMAGVFNINVSGNFTCNNTFQGTVTVIMNGTGTVSGTAVIENNLTFNTSGTITLSGTVRFLNKTLTYTAGTMVVTGSTLSILGLSGVATLNTSGMTFNNFTTGQVVFTLTSGLNVGGDFTIANTSPITINGLFNVNIAGSFFMSDGIIGSATVSLIGSGTWYHDRNSIVLGVTFNINTVGTYTITSGKTILFGNGKTMTHVSGTVVTTNTTLELQSGAATATFNTAGITWNNFLHQGNGNGVITLLSNFNFSGNFVSTTTGSAQTTINGAFNVNVAGNLTCTNTGSVIGGTSTIVMNGTGTWSGSGFFWCNLVFNTTGTVTASGTLNYSTGTLTYTAGTIVTTSTTLSIAANATLNTNGMSWNNVSFSGTFTTTLLSNITMIGNLTASATTINGLFTAFVGGGLSFTQLDGTSTILMNGTGTVFSPGTLQNNFTINTTGTITISGIAGIFNYGTGTFTYVTGTVVTTGSTLTVNLAATLNVAGVIWNNVNFTGATNKTLTSAMYVGGNFSSSGAQVNNAQLICASNIVISGTVSGTSEIVWTGTGTWSGAGTLLNSFTLNSEAGILTIDSGVKYSDGVFRYTRGKVIATAISFVGSCTLTNINKINFTTVTVTAGSVLTMNKFFEGKGNAPSRVISSNTTNYTVALSSVNEVSQFVKVANCTASPMGSLVVSTINGNGGGNIGVVILDTSMNGFKGEDYIENRFTKNKYSFYNNWGQGSQGIVRNN